MALTAAETGRLGERREAVTPPFSLVVSRALGTVVVAVRGELGRSSSAPFGVVLTDLIDGQGNLAVIVDVGDLERIGPAGLDVLAAGARALEQRGGRLTLREPSPEVRDALMLAGLIGLVAAPPPFVPARRPSALIRRAAASSRSSHPAGTDIVSHTTESFDHRR